MKPVSSPAAPPFPLYETKASLATPAARSGSQEPISHTTRISQAGRALSQQGQGANSASPQNATLDAVREALLEQIRQIQERLAQKQQELTMLIADDTQPEERKKALVQAISVEVRTLHSALTTTQGELLKLEQKKLEQLRA